jgi:gliding motility-associated-like protein
MLKRTSLLFAMIICAIGVNAQIIIDNTPTPQDLVTNTLIGNGVTVSNITFTGNTNQIGYFDEGTSNIGIPFGVVMSSGEVANTIPTMNPSTDLSGPGDPDVLATAQSVTSNPAAGMITSSHDAAVLEFDFIPQGDSVRFTFVFASEEYTTWINTQYNDAFGFYLTGPNPAGGNYTNDNFALVPGTSEPITISTIHPGLNAAYYIGTPVDHSYNGFTVPIEIEFEVVCGQSYHFKFAVADCSDGILDTGVFLEGASFSSPAVEVAVATVTGDTVVYEGCTDADFIFSRPEWQTTDTLIINYDIAGTATDGVDFPPLQNPVTFLPGEDTVILNLNPIQDAIAEGLEYLTITAYTISPCGDTLASSGTIWFLDEPDIQIDETDTLILCKDDFVLVSAIASGGFGPYSYTWSNGSPDADTAFVAGSIQGPQEYYVTATDQCGYQETDTITVTVNQTLAIDSLNQYPASACLPDGAVAAYTSGVSGTPLYNWTGPGAGNPAFIDATVWQGIPSGWYYFTVTDNVCEVTDSIFVDVENPPVAAFSGNPLVGCAPLPVTFTNASQNAVSFEWNFGSGNVINVNNMNSQTQSFVADQTVMLVAFDASNCSDTAYVQIAVQPCGCTDPNAENYNPLASIDDGSCTYPVPEVTAPNVFTPNGDGDNDLFELDHLNATEIELTILNRWGNVMYESTGPNPVWNGETAGGINAAEGTYFYKYVARGAAGDEVSGHGFVQLFRD